MSIKLYTVLHCPRFDTGVYTRIHRPPVRKPRPTDCDTTLVARYVDLAAAGWLAGIMPPKRSLKRLVKRDEAGRLFAEELLRKRRVPPVPEPEPEPVELEPAAPSRWREALEGGAECLMGTVTLGLAAGALRLMSKHVSRDAVFISVSSTFCLCGAASIAAACTDRLPVAPDTAEQAGELSDSEWVSNLIGHLWPHINTAAVEMIDHVIEPMMQRSVPSLRFKQFDLGEEQPTISVREVRSRGQRGIWLQLDVAWTSKSEISMLVGHAIPFGVRSITFKGVLYVVMQPMIPELPVVGAVQVYFIDKPDVVLHYTGAAALARMPGVERAIHQAIDDCIASMVVLPNRMSFPMAGHLDMADVSSPPPLGILWVRPVRAVDIRAGDHHLLSADSSDPYVVFELGEARYRSKTISNTLLPKWEEEDGMWCVSRRLYFY